jgi:predicted GNAT superfamily acetyltransferase
LATDRLVAEWYLDSPRVMAALNRELAPAAASCSIEIPASLEDWKSSDLRRVQSIQSGIEAKFAEGFAKGYAAISVSKTGSGGAYQLAPWSEF